MSVIKKHVRIGDCDLYLGDCLSIMPLLGKVDAVVTDPPYGTDKSGAGYGRDGRGICGDKDVVVLGLAICLAMKKAERGVMFYSDRNTPDVMRVIPSEYYYGGLAWDKKAPGMGRGIRYQHESIAVLKRVGEFSKTVFSVMRSYRLGDLHPHEKPVGLMVELIRFVGGDSVIDPFMGSGTTLVACAKLGRKGIGIELDPEYFEIACKRVQAAYDQPDLFVPQPKSLPKQEDLDL